MDKFDKAEALQDPMVYRIMGSLPNVGEIWRRSKKSRIDYNFESGSTVCWVESKYRKGHNHTEYPDANIQLDKYLVIKEKNGFLLQIFEDSWWLWDLSKTAPCRKGQWTHSKHTVLEDDKITDWYVSFDYKDALYYTLK